MNTILALLLCCGISHEPELPRMVARIKHQPILAAPKPFTTKELLEHCINMGVFYNDIDEEGHEVPNVEIIPEYTNQPIRITLIAIYDNYPRWELWKVELRTSENPAILTFIGSIRVAKSVEWGHIDHFRLYKNIAEWECRARSTDGKLSMKCIGLQHAINALKNYYDKTNGR